jgi:hypothetical protein
MSIFGRIPKRLKVVWGLEPGNESSDVLLTGLERKRPRLHCFSNRRLRSSQLFVAWRDYLHLVVLTCLKHDSLSIRRAHS